MIHPRSRARPRRNRTFLATVAAATLLLPTPGTAQAPDRAPLAAQLPASTPALALGGAFPLDRGSSDALFAHPGVLDEARGAELAIQVWGEGATGAGATGAMEWWSGAAALGVHTLNYRLPEPPGLAAGPEDDLFAPGERPVSEVMVAAGYGQEVGPVRVGGTWKWIERRAMGDRSTTAAVDLGVATEVSEVTVALSGRNLGPGLEDDGGTLDLPTEVVAGGAFSGLPTGPFDLGAAAEVAVRADGEIVPAGGVELAWWPVYGRTFVGRIGLRRVPEGEGEPYSFGGAFYGDDIGLEYAYRAFGGDDGSHRIGIFWR